MNTLKDRRECLPEVGGILHLEHFNFEVLDHDMATIFFINGLGLTRDPYRRTDETNMGVNIGMQQFHLPRRGKVTPPFYGEIGLMLPDIKIVLARLNRIESDGKFEGTAYEILLVEKDFFYLKSPWGVPMRLWESGVQPFFVPMGLIYVDIRVQPGIAKKLTKFYQGLLRAPVLLDKIRGENAVIFTMGPYQYLRFIEREIENYNLYDFHIAYYITNYNEAREIAASHGKLKGEGAGQVCFIDGPFDKKNGKTLLEFQQEWRSVYHSDFMRPLVNRWPIISEPFSVQSEVAAK